MVKKASGIPADKLEPYEKPVATRPGVERKGVTIPYASLNVHMYSFLTKEGILALRLPAKERQRLLDERSTKLYAQHGRVMKEYVEMPEGLLAKTEELKRSFPIELRLCVFPQAKVSEEGGSASSRPAVRYWPQNVVCPTPTRFEGSIVAWAAILSILSSRQ